MTHAPIIMTGLLALYGLGVLATHGPFRAAMQSLAEAISLAHGWAMWHY